VIGKNPRLLKSGKQDPSYYADLWKTIRGGHVWHGRLINRRKDATLYTEEMTINPVRNPSGAVTNFVAIKNDATERATLEELRAFLASLVESSADAIIGWSLEGKILSWNRGAEALYGYRHEETNGKAVSILAPADLADQPRSILERVKGGETVASFDTVRVSKAGSPINVSITVSPVKNPAGKITGAVASTRDITARKQAEAALTERARLAAMDADIGTALTGEGTLRESLQRGSRGGGPRRGICLHLDAQRKNASAGAGGQRGNIHPYRRRSGASAG
jgi:PAS domain S-box-containing protein